MQLSEIVGRIRKTIGEVEPSGYGSQQTGQGSWDNSQIIGYINEALGILAHDWRKESSSVISLTQGQTTIPLPANCLEDGLRSVVYNYNNGATTVNNPIRYLDFDRFNNLSQIPNASPSTSQPMDRVAYTVWGGNISLYPGAYQATDTATLYYYRTPTVLVNATDVPEIPARFHIALVEYGIAECQNAVEETNLEYDAAQKWEQYRQQFKMEMSRNQRDKGIRVRGRK